MGGVGQFFRRVFRRAELTPEALAASTQAFAEVEEARAQAKIQAELNKAQKRY
jgi:hypothetical protein